MHIRADYRRALAIDERCEMHDEPLLSGGLCVECQAEYIERLEKALVEAHAVEIVNHANGRSIGDCYALARERLAGVIEP